MYNGSIINDFMKTKGGKRPNSGRKALPYKVVRLQCPEPIAEDVKAYINQLTHELNLIIKHENTH